MRKVIIFPSSFPPTFFRPSSRAPAARPASAAIAAGARDQASPPWREISPAAPVAEPFFSFKDIDALLQRPKGAAFKAFKRLGGSLREGEHYYYLDAAVHGPTIEALRRAGRIYASTVHAVLLTEAGYHRLRRAL